jgi:mannose-6-phosphate isomerase-like protein (cupin superfamily)
MDSDIVNHALLSLPGEGQVIPAGRLKLSSVQTSGALEVIEYGEPGVPSPHVHRDLDECFYVIEGLFTFILGREEVEAPAGSIVFVPRGTRHAFRHSQGARALFFIIPAGLEGFFKELGEGRLSGRSEADMRAALAGKYDSYPVK